MSTFGDILKELRLKHGLTQKAVAEHLSTFSRRLFFI